MLLRQALEQTRAGMPTPVLFNSLGGVLAPIDEDSATVQNGNLDVHFHSVHNRAGIRSFQSTNVATGAQAS